MDLTLVVPLFNESARFPKFAPALRTFIDAKGPGSELVFVDDGSTDDTAALVEGFIRASPRSCVRFLRRPHKGKGATVAAGLGTATTELAAFCDLDLATPLVELDRIIDAAQRAPLLAIGSRGSASSRIVRHQSKIRETLGKSYNRVVQLTLLPGIVDTQCGAKAAPTAVWQKILPLCHEAEFAWDVEIIAVARVVGVPVQEIGIQWRHEEGSRVRPLRDGTEMLRAIPRIRRGLGAALRARSHHDGGGAGAFDDDNAALLAAADTQHWWFRSKATFVSLAMRRAGLTGGWLVDLGAGSGGVTAMLGWAPTDALVLESNVQLIAAARSRHAMVGVRCDTASVPLADATADVVCLLDVIEHLPDPVPTLKEAARILADGGRVIVNVPAHPKLWSAADEVLGHARRYTRRTLRHDLEASGLEVQWMSHVFSWLALPVWLKRRAVPASEPQLGLDVNSPLLDRVSMFLTRVEWAIASRVSLPLGTSILCVCAKTDDGTSVPRAR